RIAGRFFIDLPWGRRRHALASGKGIAAMAAPTSSSVSGEAFAVTARATFLCLCKETWRKKAHSACTPGALHRVRGAGGTTEGASCPRRKRRTALCGALYQVRVLSPAPAAPEGPRRSTSTATARNHSSKSRASAHANPVGAAEAASSCLAVASALVGAA